jgi:hypothetical protein
MKLTMEEMLDQIEIKLHELETQIERKVTDKKVPNPENLKKNSHLHLFMETSLHDKLKNEAKEKCMSFSELVRWKLRENNQLDRIEGKVDKILCKNNL